MSTLAERLRAAFEAVKEWPEKDGDPRTVGDRGFMNLLKLRNLIPEALATLEGLAAPGERQRKEKVFAALDAAPGIMRPEDTPEAIFGDAPDSQQPTPDPLQFAYDSGMPKTWVEFADALDRFAAQRVTAAAASASSAAAGEQAFSSEYELWLRSHFDAWSPANKADLLIMLDEARAATQWARKTASDIIPHFLQMGALTQDQLLEIEKTILRNVGAALVAERAAAAAAIEALSAPQNPGDAIK